MYVSFFLGGLAPDTKFAAQFSVVTTGSTSIIRDTGTGTFWVSAPSKPGSEVVASNTAFNWKITPVGNNKYRCETLLLDDVES
jgi:hypothetical protein